MKEFMFLFRFGTNEKKASPEEFQKEAMKWQEWTSALMKEGRLTPGLRLSSNAKVIKTKDKRVQDGPFAEGKEVVGSYCTVKARDLDEAVEMAKKCPIMDHEDASVEVREIVVYK